MPFKAYVEHHVREAGYDSQYAEYQRKAVQHLFGAQHGSHAQHYQQHALQYLYEKVSVLIFHTAASLKLSSIFMNSSPVIVSFSVRY